MWAHDDTRVTLEAPGGDLDAVAGTVVWPLDIAPGGRAVLTWRVEVDDVGAHVTPPPAAPTWSQPALRVDDRRLSTLLRRRLNFWLVVAGAGHSGPTETCEGQ